MKILVIDNYDSFVYNLVHILYNIGGAEIEVRKNDQILLNEINQFDKILLSPGPGIPQEAGLMPQIIKEYAGQKSILGICLGHQAIAEAFGGTLHNLKHPLHGIASHISILKEDDLFLDIPKSFKIGHYHSWIVNDMIPDELEVLARDAQNNIAAIKHKKYDVKGLQFHPESILTENGFNILKNWKNTKTK